MVATAAALVVSAGLPTLAFGQATAVDGLLKTLGLGGTSGTTDGSGDGADEKAGVPPSYEPPLHGSNPHGQGSGAVVDITPENSNPYPGDPGDGDEEVIVGDSRGEQNADGSYQGTVTLAYLLGSPIIQVQTGPGESEDGPLQPLQDGLDQLCAESGDQLCLTVLGMHSSTTDNSSTNSFQAVGAHIGGEEGINAEVLTSNGNISDDGTCQTSHGDSSVASASIGGELTADALQGSSTSTSCNDGSQSVDQSSTVVNLGGTGLPIPAAGCDDGTANTVFDALSPIAATVCNADDTNGSQTGAPYGVREALTVFALIAGDTSLIKATTASPESHAVAPGGGQQPPTTTPPGGGGGAGEQGGGGQKGLGAGGEGAGEGGGGGGAAGEAAAGEGELAFTGADLLVLGLVGGALILGGLGLTTMAGRRHRQTV